MIKKWTKIKQKVAFTAFRTLLQRTFRLPNGKTNIYDILEDRSGVAMIVHNNQDGILLNKEFRPGPETIVYDIPAGMINDGETPLQAAKRELLEETGYTGTFKLLCTFPSSSYSTGHLSVFICEKASKIQEPQLDDTEWLEANFYSREQIESLLKKRQAGSLIGLIMAGRSVKNKKN